MKPRTLLAAISLATCIASTIAADKDDGWRPLFNGKDLTGWVPVQVAPNTFTVRDGIIVSTGVPTGVMRTDRQYENFELELEWKHIVPQGNAGLFVWSYPITAVGQPFTKSIEVQILDGRNSETHTSHGDIFSIHGARMKPDRPHPRGAERCLPSEFRCKPAGEWNHYRVVCNNGVIKLSVNGKEVSGGSECTPRKGYICLESEGTECHFRNIRLKELPSTNPKPEEIAPEADNTISIYNGLNLDGWTSKAIGNWKPKDWILEYDGKGTDADLWFNKPLRNFEMIIDWRVTDQDAKEGLSYTIDHRWKNSEHRKSDGSTHGVRKVGEWTRTLLKVTRDGLRDETHGGVSGATPGPGADETWDERQFAIKAPSNKIQIANIYLKELPEKSKPEASLAPRGFVPIFVGNLDGWTAKQKSGWKPTDDVLEFDGNSDKSDANLWTTKKYRDYVLTFSYRVPGKHDGARDLGVMLRENAALNFEQHLPNNQWNRAVITVRGKTADIELNGKPHSKMTFSDTQKESPIALQPRPFPIEFANIYIKELKGHATTSLAV